MTEDDEAAALKVAVSASLALMVMLADFIWLIRDEVNVVWGRLQFWNARVYLFLRYMGLVSQIFNVYFTVRMYSGVATTPAGCQLWFSFQVLVVQVLLASVEGALMHRIYALFQRNRYVLMVLVTLATGQVSSMAVSASLSLPSNKHTVTCMMVKSNPGSAYFGMTTMMTSILIFFMTYFRFLSLPIRWTRHAISWVMMRDTSLAVLAISGWMLFLTLCSLQIIRPSIGGNIIYYWLVCILWISIGRIIVNQAILSDDEHRTTMQLTTQIEIGVPVSRHVTRVSEVVE